MLIHGTNSSEMPLMIDTTKIEATYCSKDNYNHWRVVLILSSGTEFFLPMYNTIVVNGVNIMHEGEMDDCKRMAEIINTIVELERQDPPVDMDKFSKIAVAKPKRKKSK